MFKTPQQMGLTLEEIDIINERLWAEREPGIKCPDCQVKPGEIHEMGCDIAHCLNCGEQTLFEDCCENPENDMWTGLWPGVKECYELKLICYDTCKWPDTDEDIGWCFDLNRLEYNRRFKG